MTELRPHRLSTVVATCMLAACLQQSPEQLLAKAKRSLEAKDRAAAVIDLRAALQEDANLSEARLLLGDTLLAMGDAAGAEVALAKALEQGQDADIVIPKLAQARYELGKYEQVLSEFNGSKVQGKSARAQLLATLARTRLALDQQEDAQRVNESALELDPQQPQALLNKVSLLFNRRDLDGARQVLDELLARSPDLIQALLFRGQLNASSPEQLASAEEDFTKVLKLDPASVGAHSALINLALLRNDPALARARHARMLERLPRHPQSQYFGIVLALQEDKLEQARELMPMLLRSRLLPPHFLQVAGILAFRQGQLLEAEKYLSQTLHAQPGNTTARLLLAQTLLRRGSPDKALSTVEPMVSSAKPNPEALSIVGQALLLKGQASKAQAAFERAVAADPTDIRNRAALALTEVDRGHAERGLAELDRLAASDKSTRIDVALISKHLERREYAKAIEAIDRLEAKNPGQANTAVLRGTVEVARGQRLAARAAFERAIKLTPTHYLATASLALLDIEDKHPEEAKHRFERLLSVDPNNLEAELALVGLKAGGGAAAADITSALRAITKRHPRSSAAWLALINHLSQQGEHEATRAAAQEASSANPTQTVLLEALGQAQLRSGDLRGALASFGKLVELQPDWAQAHYRLADAQLASKQVDSGQQSLRRALQLQPDYAPAQLLLAKHFIQNRQIPELKALAAQVKRSQPRSNLGPFFEAEAEALAKNWAGAARAYQAGMDLRPTSELAIKLAQSLRLAGKNAEAERFSKTWMIQNPKDTTFLGSIADNAMAANQLEDALSLYQKILAEQPKNAAAANNAAWLTLQLKRPGARALAELATREAPLSGIYWDTLAAILLAEGQSDGALSAQRRAVELTPGVPVLRLRLAKLLIEKGHKAEATKELSELESLGDKFKLQSEVKALRRLL